MPIDSNSVVQLGALITFQDEMQMLMVSCPSLLAVTSIRGLWIRRLWCTPAHPSAQAVTAAVLLGLP